MDSIGIGAKCDDVMRVSPAGETSSGQTGRAKNTMEPRVYSAQQTKYAMPCTYRTHVLLLAAGETNCDICGIEL